MATALKATFLIDGPPLPWPRARHYGKKHFNPTEYTQYKAIVALLAQSAWGGREPLIGPVALEAIFLVERKVSGPPDTTNLLKALEDACEGIIYRNDSQIVRATGEKIQDPNPRTYVRFRGIQPRESLPDWALQAR